MKQAIITIDDINPTPESIELLKAELASIYSHVVRLSNTIRGSGKTYARLYSEFAQAVYNKIVQIAKMSSSEDNLNPGILAIQA